MDALEAIQTVRVVREFADRPLTAEHERAILNAARRTASSKNKQRWAFIVCREREHLRRLGRVGPYADHIAGAALAVALLAPARDDFWDLGRAAQNMVLAAWELGVGSVPATVYDDDVARRELAYPVDWACPYLLSFGYPVDSTVLTRANRPGGRKKLADVVHEEHW